MIRKTILKKVAFLLTLAMMLSTVACGTAKQQESSSGDAQTSSVEESTSQAATEEKTEEEEAWDPLAPYEETVTLSFSRNSQHISTYPEGVTNEDNAYIDLVRDKLNIECETFFEASAGDDYDRQVSLAIASGEIPDILVLHGSNGTGRSFLKELYENELIYDLTELYEKYASDELKARYASYEGNAALEAASVDGHLAGLPYAAGNFYSMIWIRQDWVEALDLKLDTDGDEIITREELVSVAKAFIEKDPGGTGNTVGLSFVPGISGMTTLTDSFGAYAGSYMPNGDGTVSHGSTAPEMKEALAWVHELYEEGVLDAQYGTRTSDDIDQLIYNGQLGIVTGAWHVADWKLINLYKLDSNSTWRAYNLDNGNGKVNFPSSDVTSDDFVVVSKKCENPEAVFKIIELLNIYWNSLLPAEKEAYAPELKTLEDTGINGAARPISVDINGVDFAYKGQVLPALEYLDGTRDTTEGFTSRNEMVLEGILAYEEDYTTMDPAIWASHHSRMYGVMHAQKLTENGLYEMAYPIYNYSETMASNPVDLNGLMNETFAKIIIGELSIDAFDDYVKERNSQGDAVICEELTASLQ